MALLGTDGLEAACLCDMEGLGQVETRASMGRPRGTVRRLVRPGRAGVLRALVEWNGLLIGEGDHHEDLHPDCE